MTTGRINQVTAALIKKEKPKTMPKGQKTQNKNPKTNKK